MTLRTAQQILLVSYEITWDNWFLRPYKIPALALCKCRIVQGMAQDFKYTTELLGRTESKFIILGAELEI